MSASDLTVILFLICGTVFFVGYLRAMRKPTPAPDATPTAKTVHPCEVHHHLNCISAQVRVVDGNPVTYTLKHCPECRNYWVMIYPGSWTIEELLLVEAPAKEQIAELERMAR